MFAFLPINNTANQTPYLPFLLEGRLTVPATVGTFVNVVTNTLPAAYRAVIVGYGVSVRDPSYDWSGAISFRLLTNASPFGDNNTGSWTTQRGSVENLMPCYIETSIGAVVSFQAKRAIASASPVPYVVDFLATGIMIPVGAEPMRDAGRYRV